MDNKIKECKYYCTWDTDTCRANSRASITVNNKCTSNPNCYYKQLLAEQAKNKKLVEALEDISTMQFFCLKSNDKLSKNIDGFIDWDVKCSKCELNYCPLRKAQQALNEVNNAK